MADPNRDEIARLELLHRAHPDGLIFPYLAEAYRKSGQLDRAEDVLLKGLTKHRDHSSAHVVLGRVRMDKGQAEEAETAFRRVLQLDPDNVVALRSLAELAVATERVPDAIDYFKQLQHLNPNDDEVAGRIAELESGVVRPRPLDRPRPRPHGDNGNEAHMEALDDWPSSPPAPKGNAPEEPVTDGPPVRSASPPEEQGEVYTETMAELYTRQGLYDRAERVYRRLLAMHPGEPRLTSRLEMVERLRREEMAERRRAAEAAAEAQARAEARKKAEQPLPFEVEEDAPAREPAGPAAAPARAEPGIGAYLADVLAWKPGVREQKPRSDAEYGVSAPDVAPEPAAPEPLEEHEQAAVAGPAGTAAKPGTKPAAPESRAGAAAAAEPPTEAEAPSGPAWPWDAGTAPGSETAASTAPKAPEQTPEPSEPVSERPVEAGGAGEAATLVGAGATEHGVRPSAGDRRLQAQPEAVLALTDLLVGLLEFRDPFFRGGSSLTRLMAAAVGREMELPETEVTNLSLAAVLRDLGRLALGGKLVSGSQAGGKTPEVRRRIERHVDLALHLMEGIDLPASVRYAVRHHHERWDGRGYPDGLAGEQIPLSARILAVVDSFSAMVAARPYRLPRKVPEAAAELRAEAGTRYDPRVVDALLRVLARRDQPHLGFVLRHHILIVSPDQPGATVTAAKLCSAGYLAEVAPDADSARDRLQRVPVAAVVVAAELEDQDAAAFVRELRSNPMLAQLPVVVADAPEVERRVELLENGADVCFAPDASYSELQGTLGALIRRAFRRRAGENGDGGDGDGDAPWLALQGDIQDFPLSWLLQVMKYDSRTAAIGIRGATDLGVIYLESGDACHAQIRGGPKGEAALRAMLGWRKGRFTVDPEARPPERTITTPITHLLLDEAVAEDHAAAGQIFGAVKAGV